MQIILDQLKEIAKAGYGEFVTNTMWSDSDFSYDLENFRYVIKYANEPIFMLWCNHKMDYLYFDSSRTVFNHLAAIRKMEELGLIEK